MCTTLARGPIAVRVTLSPLSLDVTHGGRTLVGNVRPWAADGDVNDRFVQMTEGVIASEDLRRRPLEAADVERVSERHAAIRGSGWTLDVTVASDRVLIELSTQATRHGIRWDAGPGEHFTGLGARHGLTFDQAGRRVRLGADRRYTGPACPPEMLAIGGIPQGDYAPAPWLISSERYALWLDTAGDGVEFDLGATTPGEATASIRGAAGPLRLSLLTSASPAAQLRSYCRLTGFPALLPEWAYGHWKSRDVYAHQRDVLDDFDGYRRSRLPLDAIVIDSPWETQYNTWEFNPHQFPDAAGMIVRMRAAGVRTVVWVTPWINLESVDGQRPPDPESEHLHREPAPKSAAAAGAGYLARGSHADTDVTR